MRCLTCGTKNSNTAAYCGACGAALAAGPRRPTPPASIVPRSRRPMGRRVMVFIAILGLVLLVQLIGAPTIVLVLAILPALVYYGIAVWIDRYEPEPWWILAGAFLWGASAAALISGIVNTLGSQLVSSELGAGAGNAFGASISAPFIEETTKGAALLAVYLWRRHELNGLLDGIVYASMVGLGFAMTENVQYYARALELGPDVLGATFVLRGLVLPALHPLFTSMTGIGLVLGLRATNRRLRIIAPLAGLGAAILLHSAWNTSPVVFGPLLILPVFLTVMMLIRRSIRQEAAVVRAYLPEGMVPREDVERLGSIRARIADSLHALRMGGLRGLEAREEYVTALGDLAFDRARAAQGGVDGATPSRDDGARELLAQLRREWRSPTTR